MKRSARAAEADGGGVGERIAGAPDADRGGAAKRSARAVKTGVPGPADGRKFARVFMSGRSQAVRLPKEFRFDTDRVVIRREGRHVVLSPPFKDWDDYFRNGARFTDDFLEAMDELDREELPLEEREPFD